MSFLLYPDPNNDWNEGEKTSRTAQYDTVRTGRSKHGEKFDLSAWSQAHDDQYLGLCGPLYNGRMYGNDSSSIQSIMNPPAFWKRVSYRPKAEEILERHKEKNKFMTLSLTGGKTLESDPSETKQKPVPWKTLSTQTAAAYKPKCEPVDYDELLAKYPKFEARRERFEKADFFNTLGNKYEIRPGRAAQVDRKAHSSTKAEINFMAHKW